MDAPLGGSENLVSIINRVISALTGILTGVTVLITLQQELLTKSLDPPYRSLEGSL